VILSSRALNAAVFGASPQVLHRASRPLSTRRAHVMIEEAHCGRAGTDGWCTRPVRVALVRSPNPSETATSASRWPFL